MEVSECLVLVLWNVAKDGNTKQDYLSFSYGNLNTLLSSHDLKRKNEPVLC